MSGNHDARWNTRDKRSTHLPSPASCHRRCAQQCQVETIDLTLITSLGARDRAVRSECCVSISSCRHRIFCIHCVVQDCIGSSMDPPPLKALARHAVVRHPFMIKAVLQSSQPHGLTFVCCTDTTINDITKVSVVRMCAGEQPAAAPQSMCPPRSPARSDDASLSMHLDLCWSGVRALKDPLAVLSHPRRTQLAPPACKSGMKSTAAYDAHQFGQSRGHHRRTYAQQYSRTMAAAQTTASTSAWRSTAL